jgi:hypothetical protein
MVKIPENLNAEELAKLRQLNAQVFSEMSDEQRTDLLKNVRLHISKDAVHWAPLYGGGNSYREILGFKQGQLSFGFLASVTEGLMASMNIRTVK